MFSESWMRVLRIENQTLLKSYVWKHYMKCKFMLDPINNYDLNGTIWHYLWQLAKQKICNNLLPLLFKLY